MQETSSDVQVRRPEDTLRLQTCLQACIAAGGYIDQVYGKVNLACSRATEAPMAVDRMIEHFSL